MNQDIKKVNILVVIRWPVGGIRTYIRYVYKKLKGAYHFTIVGPELPEIEFMKKDMADLDVEFVTVGANKSSLSMGKAVYNLLQNNKIDLIHSHGFTSGLITSLINLVYRKPHVITSHDILQSSQFKGISGVLKKFSLSYILPSADRIQSVSHDAQNNLITFIPRLKKFQNKLTVIFNGIDINEFRSAEAMELRRKYNLSNDVFLVGFIGRFMSQKGFSFLIRAIDNIKDKVGEFRVIVFGSYGFVREDQRMIESLGLSSYFIFHGYEQNIACAVKGLDVVVMPSLWEACPILPMEVLVSGVPMIGSDCIGLREVLNDTPSIVFNSGNVEQLAEAIVNVMNKADKSDFLEYMEEARNRYDSSNTAAQLEAVFSELI